MRASVVWSQQYIAGDRQFGKQLVKTLTFNIGGQQDSMPTATQLDDCTVAIVSSLRPRRPDPVSRRMQYFHPHAPRCGQSQVLVDMAHRYVSAVQLGLKSLQGGRLGTKHDGRNVHDADREAIEQFGDRIEVVRIGVRQYHCVDVADSTRPQD